MLRTFKLSLLIFMQLILARLPRAFDIRNHLSTKTRYSWRIPIPNAPSIYSTQDPEGYVPHHLWFLSRHGTRWPTKGRMDEINSLYKLFKDATNKEEYPWMQNWKSPVHALEFASGDLHSIGQSILATSTTCPLEE